MTIRPAKPDDRTSILTIQSASPEASAWDPAGYECWVATENELVIGFSVARTVAPGESEILNLAVAPSYRRQGVARELIRHAVRAHPGDWFLELRESNLPARRLYEGEGFRPCGLRQNYYDNPSEAAIVMRLQS